jgi:threonine/homoserine/homoserine lactone efflux protein
VQSEITQFAENGKCSVEIQCSIIWTLTHTLLSKGVRSTLKAHERERGSMDGHFHHQLHSSFISHTFTSAYNPSAIIFHTQVNFCYIPSHISIESVQLFLLLTTAPSLDAVKFFHVFYLLFHFRTTLETLQGVRAAVDA